MFLDATQKTTEEYVALLIQHHEVLILENQLNQSQ